MNTSTKQDSEGRSGAGLQHRVSYDGMNDVLTFDGFRFSGGLMRTITETPCGVMFRVVNRKDGVVTFSEEIDPIARAAPDMLKALRDLLDCLDLAEKHDDLPLPFAGHGHDFIDKARAAIANAVGDREGDASGKTVA